MENQGLNSLAAAYQVPRSGAVSHRKYPMVKAYCAVHSDQEGGCWTKSDTEVEPLYSRINTSSSPVLSIGLRNKDIQYNVIRQAYCSNKSIQRDTEDGERRKEGRRKCAREILNNHVGPTSLKCLKFRVSELHMRSCDLEAHQNLKFDG